MLWSAPAYPGPLDPHSHLHPNSVCHEEPKVSSSNPTPSCPPPRNTLSLLLHLYATAGSFQRYLVLFQIIHFCLLASCGLNPAATKHLIYDCFSKRRHCDLPGPSSASGNQALAHTAALYTPLASPPHSSRQLDHQHTKSPSFAARHVYFRPRTRQGHHHFQQTVGAGRLSHRRSLRG